MALESVNGLSDSDKRLSTTDLQFESSLFFTGPACIAGLTKGDEMRIKANGVPSWVTALAALIGLFSMIAGLAIMTDPTIMDIDDSVVGRQWGGRNIGLGAALVVAVALRDARAYMAGFAAGLFRDIGDLVAAIDDGASPIVPIVFLVVGAAAIGAVFQAGGLSAKPTWAMD